MKHLFSLTQEWFEYKNERYFRQIENNQEFIWKYGFTC